jgi:hypothetical protein
MKLIGILLILNSIALTALVGNHPRRLQRNGCHFVFPWLPKTLAEAEIDLTQAEVWIKIAIKIHIPKV